MLLSVICRREPTNKNESDRYAVAVVKDGNIWAHVWDTCLGRFHGAICCFKEEEGITHECKTMCVINFNVHLCSCF